MLENTVAGIESTDYSTHLSGIAFQADATNVLPPTSPVCIATDPPYYDNIGYAALSDFFYVWLRRALAQIEPELTTTLLTPKAEELIAEPARHSGDRGRAKEFFEDKLGEFFGHSKNLQCNDVPLSIIYAFKQAEEDVLGTASTGW